MITTMGYKLHKNAIITGGAGVDFFCLVCDSFLQTKQEAYSHIESSRHCENLSSTLSHDKYKGHNIIKTGAGYFCTFCNILLRTAIKVDSHIIHHDHIQNRGKFLFKRLDHKIIAFNNIHINDSTWHGLKEKECSICDKEFEDEIQHKKETGHILNLIQKPVEFGLNDAIYRKIDQSTVHCLTCDLLILLNKIDVHFDATDHLEGYEHCKINVDNSPKYVEPIIESQVNANGNQNNLTEEITEPVHINDEMYDAGASSSHINAVLNVIKVYDAKMIDINFETHTAFCRKCRITVELDPHDIDIHIDSHTEHANVETIENPVNDNKENGFTLIEHSETRDTVCNDNIDNSYVNVAGESHQKTSEDLISQVKDEFAVTKITSKRNSETVETKRNFKPGTLRGRQKEETKNEKNLENTIKYAKENHIMYNGQSPTAFCCLCQVQLPFSMKSIKEHTKGVCHHKNLEKSKQTKSKVYVPTLKKQSSLSFVYSLSNLENKFQSDMIINNQHHITDRSFFLFTLEESNSILECFICRKKIPYIFYKKAAATHFHSHDAGFWNIPVIISMPSEFIREVSYDEFHCGYCNIVVTNWSEMEKHLKSSSHEHIKTSRTLLMLVQRNRVY